MQDTPRLRGSPEMLQVLCDGHLDISGLGVHNDVEHHSFQYARPQKGLYILNCAYQRAVITFKCCRRFTRFDHSVSILTLILKFWSKYARVNEKNNTPFVVVLHYNCSYPTYLRRGNASVGIAKWSWESERIEAWERLKLGPKAVMIGVFWIALLRCVAFSDVWLSWRRTQDAQKGCVGDDTGKICESDCT